MVSDVDANSVQKRVKRLFNYVPDSVQFDRPEHWKAHADAVRDGIVFDGDCDDFAMTCAVVLVGEGASESDVGIVYCNTERGTPHLVCLYKGWVLDNRADWAISWDKTGYEYRSVMYLSSPGEWLAFSEK